MALVTKQQIYEAIQSRLEGGSPGAGKKFEKRQIYAFMASSINAKLKMSYLKEILANDETIPEGLVIACYNNIPVSTYKTKLSRAALPAMPVSLRRNMGVWFVGPAADGNIVPVDPTQLDKYLVAEYVVGGVSRIIGNDVPTPIITGVVAGGTQIVCDQFTGRYIQVVRGHVYIPGANPGDGSNYFTVAGNTITLSSPLAEGEYIRFEAYTSKTMINQVSKVVIESFIDNSITISGDAVIVVGLTAGNNIITCAGFIGKDVNIVRGDLPLPGIDPGDGSDYYTKDTNSESIILSTNLVKGEYVKIETL